MIAGLYDKNMFKFVGNCLIVFQSGYAFLSAVNERSCCSTSSPAFGGVSVLDFGHSKRCVVISRCFNLHIPNDLSGVSFHMFILHLYIPFVRCLLRSLADFFISLFSQL